MSETRGFGVCVPDGPGRCDGPGGTTPWGTTMALSDCGFQLAAIGGPGEEPGSCVCMLLTPTIATEEDADNGWAVSQQTCLAYRARYPEEVRCMTEAWEEL